MRSLCQVIASVHKFHLVTPHFLIFLLKVTDKCNLTMHGELVTHTKVLKSKQFSLNCIQPHSTKLTTRNLIDIVTSFNKISPFRHNFQDNKAFIFLCI